jgi:hypothetical protein
MIRVPVLLALAMGLRFLWPGSLAGFSGSPQTDHHPPIGGRDGGAAGLTLRRIGKCPGARLQLICSRR